MEQVKQYKQKPVIVMQDTQGSEGLTKREQRALIKKYGAARLDHAPFVLLGALVTSNFVGKKHKDDPEPDAEAKPFRVGLGTLAAKTHLSRWTIARHLETLVKEQLLTIVENKGKASHYQLSLGIMETWLTTDAASNKRKKVLRAKKAKWMRNKRHEGKNAIDTARADTRADTVRAFVISDSLALAAMPDDVNPDIIAALAELAQVALDAAKAEKPTTAEQVQQYMRDLQEENRLRAEEFATMAGV